VSSSSTDRGDGLVRAGSVVFVVGAVGAIATFVPLFLDLTPLPSVAYWISMLMPAGFLLSLAGLLLSARGTKRV
jgi:hypothetical protein